MKESTDTFPRLAVETEANTEGMYAQLQSKYNDFIRTIFIQERISSQAEVRQIQSWLDSIRHDSTAIKEALNNYEKHAVPLLHSELQKKSGAVAELTIALQDNIISKQSYDEWITWMEDISRDSEEKLTSMAKILPSYLQRRRTLASKRQGLLGSKGFASLEVSPNYAIRTKASTLKNTKMFLSKLSIEEREDLLTELINTLPLIEAEKSLFEQFDKLLSASVGVHITADSKKRWIARFKDPRTSPKKKVAFVTAEFPAYIERWKVVHGKRDELLKKPHFHELWQKDIADIGIFKSDTKFMELHYDKKVDMVKRIDNALIAKQKGKEEWTNAVTAEIRTAATAGYISANRVGELVASMRESERTLHEVKNFIKEWAKLRYRFNKVEEQMTKEKAPQGLHRIPVELFLMMKWEKRKSYVAEVEYRLQMESRNGIESTLPYGLMLRIRHELDSANWQEVRNLLNEAWPMAITEQDKAQLESMENYLKNFGSSAPKESSTPDKARALRSALETIDSAYKQLPTEVKPFYDHAFKHDSNCAWTVGVMLYNVQWGLERGYQPQDLSKVRERAAAETPMRMRPGMGHGDGLENNLIDGHGRPAIREEGWGPQNICTSSSEAGRIVDSANANKFNFSYWYWNNLIIKGVSAGQYSSIAYILRRQIVSGMRTLEAQGETVASARNYLALLN